MKYTQKSFTFVGSTSDTYAHAHAVCSTSGHMSTDVRGKCLRCGETLPVIAAAPLTRYVGGLTEPWVQHNVRYEAGE